MTGWLKFAQDNLELLIVVLFFGSVLLNGIELIWEFVAKRMSWDRAKEMLASYSTLIPTKAAEFLMLGVTIKIYFFVYSLVPWYIPLNTWSIVLAVVVVDFLYYWEHRLEHETRVLWTYHSVHHSSNIYNYSVAFRILFTEQFTSFVFFLPAVLVGFHPIVVLLSLGVILSYQYWLHTEMIPKLGILERIFCTPSLHRVHHGSDEKYLDKNYGAIFSVWDQLFGTYQVEEERPTYGLVNPIGSSNPIKVHFYEFGNLWRDLRAAKSFGEVWRRLFFPPGWQPEEDTKQPLASKSTKSPKTKGQGHQSLEGSPS